MMHRFCCGIAFWVGFGQVGCLPDDSTRPSIIVDDVILAVRSEPAEVPPGASVELMVLSASPNGLRSAADAQWSLCRIPKPASEANSVNDACLHGDAAPVFAQGEVVTTAIPSDACTLHGPDPPPGEFRPRDADASGGYYQPFRVEIANFDAIASARLSCNLANAPLAIAQRFRAEYRRNINPIITVLEPSNTEEPLPIGSEINWMLGWPAQAAEIYLYYDPTRGELMERRESISISWYATAGHFALDRNGRAEDDLALQVVNTWRAPKIAGPVTFWVVLRDSRGGLTWKTWVVDIVDTQTPN